MDINVRYRAYSEQYWAGVRNRQKAYLAQKRAKRVHVEKNEEVDTKAEVVKEGGQERQERQERQEEAVKTVRAVQTVRSVNCLCTGL